MKIAQIQFAPWDKVYNFSLNNLDLDEGDKVVVRTELGMEVGEVVGFTENAITEKPVKSLRNNGASTENTGNTENTKNTGNTENTENPVNPDKSGNGASTENTKNTEDVEKSRDVDDNDNTRELKPILRIANERDLEKIPGLSEKKKALDYCMEIKDKYKLPMKFIDVHFAYDGSRITFAFIADGRVDFRELVKDLTRHFGRTIRLQQIGIRDEAKYSGDFGHCGQEICCRGHLKELASISSDMAEIQQCSHRGSDRISGICGRLMCCLAYEQKGYEELYKKMPPIGTKVNVDGKSGVIIGHHTLKQSVDVEFKAKDGEDKIRVEVDLNRKKS